MFTFFTFHQNKTLEVRNLLQHVCVSSHVHVRQNVK